MSNAINVWKMRAEGAPQYVDNLTDIQILEGVDDGTWEPTDEVMGPNDTEWQALETHPHFEAVMADYEPPRLTDPPDESRLDMNPLIDVALVLLVFFILTTSYEALRKVIDLPTGQSNDDKMKKGDITIIQEEELTKLVQVSARMEAGKPVIRVNDEIVPEDKLQARLTEALKKSDRREIMVDVQGVNWGTEVKILDAAKGAGCQQVLKRARTPPPS